MNARHIILIGTASLLTLACSKESSPLQAVPEEAAATRTVFYADLGSSDETRTYIDEDYKLHWTKDDLVSIFQTTGNGKFRFTGETGDRSGSFEEVSPAGSGEALSHTYSVYPYSGSTAVSPDGTLSLTLPGTQQYVEKSFGLGANTMVCRTDDDKLFFKNACGYLVIKMFGEGVAVKSVSLEANNGEAISGKATVTFEESGIPSIVMGADGGNGIKVSCETAVSLGTSSSDYTEFWFVVPPVTFEGGFTITVTGTGGGTCSKSTTKAIGITRNEVTSMSPFEVVLTGGNQIGDGEEQDGGDY